MAQVNQFGPRDAALALGTFLVVGAVLVHLLVARTFATSLPVQEIVTRSMATGAVVLDPVTGEQDRPVRLDRRRSVVPTTSQVVGADAYVVSTSTVAESNRVVARQRWTGVQQWTTGQAISSPFNTEQVSTFDANGNAVERRRPARDMGGLLLRFPRDTEPRAYPRWDPETGIRGTADFVRTTSLFDSRVLQFRQRSADSSTDPALAGVRTIADTTMWVRPETGTVVKTSTRVLTRFTADQRTVLDATFVDEPRDVRAASQRVDDMVWSRTWTTTIGPAMALVLGMVLLTAAVLEGSTGRLTSRMRRSRPMEVS